MGCDKAEAGHPSEVLVEGPQGRIPIRRDGGDEQVRDAESVAGVAGRVDPAVDALPCSRFGVEDGERRQYTPEAGAIGAGGSSENLDPHRRRQRHLVGIEESFEMPTLRPCPVPEG